MIATAATSTVSAASASTSPTIAVIRMQAKYKFSWFYMPWIILSGSFLINLIISSLVDEPIYSGGLASIFIILFIAGTVSIAQMFPFAVGLSVRRSDLFKGTLLAAIGFSSIISVLLFLLSLFEGKIAPWRDQLHFFHLPYVNDGPSLLLWPFTSWLCCIYACLAF